MFTSYNIIISKITLFCKVFRHKTFIPEIKRSVRGIKRLLSILFQDLIILFLNIYTITLYLQCYIEKRKQGGAKASTVTYTMPVAVKVVPSSRAKEKLPVLTDFCSTVITVRMAGSGMQCSQGGCYLYMYILFLIY